MTGNLEFPALDAAEQPDELRQRLTTDFLDLVLTGIEQELLTDLDNHSPLVGTHAEFA